MGGPTKGESRATCTECTEMHREDSQDNAGCRTSAWKKATSVRLPYAMLNGASA
jgi:hypothetical protein